jgi:hypothetical protein
MGYVVSIIHNCNDYLYLTINNGKNQKTFNFTPLSTEIKHIDEQ